MNEYLVHTLVAWNGDFIYMKKNNFKSDYVYLCYVLTLTDELVFQYHSETYTISGKYRIGADSYDDMYVARTIHEPQK